MKIVVPCGKCSSCLDIKSSTLSLRVDNECKLHKYGVFFTLTYRHEDLPMFKCVGRSYDRSINQNVYTMLDNRYTITDFAYCRRSLDFPESFFDGMKYPVKSHDLVIPYASKTDIQKFLKRLRKNINKIVPHEKIRYFICSEYCPTTYRPHFHGIIWTDNTKVFNSLLGVSEDRTGLHHIKRSDSLIFKSWSLCDSVGFTAYPVLSGASSYVASYCNSYIDLPKVLQTKFTMPFTLASKNPILGSPKNDETLVNFAVINSTVRLGNFTKQFTDDVLPVSILRHYFGRPNGLRRASYSDLLCLYEKYDKQNYDRSLDQKIISADFHDYIFKPIFDYTHYLWYKHVKFYCSHEHYFPWIDSDGCLHYDSFRLTPCEFLRHYYDLKQDIISCQNEKFYASIEYENYSSYNYLSRYCNTLISLPRATTSFNLTKHCILTNEEFHHLYSLGSDSLYHLDIDEVNRLFNLHRSEFSYKHALHVKHSNSTKIYNDTHVDLFPTY